MRKERVCHGLVMRGINGGNELKGVCEFCFVRYLFDSLFFLNRVGES